MLTKDTQKQLTEISSNAAISSGVDAFVPETSRGSS
jgi:hypothetical protein